MEEPSPGRMSTAYFRDTRDRTYLQLWKTTEDCSSTLPYREESRETG